jgi:hypothetical protein
VIGRMSSTAVSMACLSSPVCMRTTSDSLGRGWQPMYRDLKAVQLDG